MKYLLLIIFIFLGCYSYAQTIDTVGQHRETFVLKNQDSSQPSKKSSKTKKIIVAINQFSRNAIRKPDSKRVSWRGGHWAGIGIHYCGLITSLSNVNLPAEASYLAQTTKSIGVTLNPIDYTLLRSRHVGLVTGIGFEFNNFRFENNITLKQVNGVTVPDYWYDQNNIHLSKSKLYTGYLNVPLLIEFQMGRNNNFFINFGVVGGLRIGTHTKIKIDDGPFEGIRKNYSNFGLQNFHYGYTFSLGYSHFAITATYYRSVLFKSGKGPQVQQINVGLSFIL